jgi:hypothetical protein
VDIVLCVAVLQEELKGSWFFCYTLKMANEDPLTYRYHLRMIIEKGEELLEVVKKSNREEGYCNKGISKN